METVHGGGALTQLFSTLAFVAIAPALLSGCSAMSAAGPSARSISQAAELQPSGLRLVNLDISVARSLQSVSEHTLFNDAVGQAPYVKTIGYGDQLSISVWEAPPATLFGSIGSGLGRTSGEFDLGERLSMGRSSSFPEQEVSEDGTITVPFAGRVSAVGLTTQELEAEIVRRLRGKAHLPQAIVSIARNASSTVTVVGEVQRSGIVPLTARGERVLDAVAMAGGTRQPVEKITIQLGRAGVSDSIPLEMLVRDPAKNVRLVPGDVLTAYYQPLSFTALGATGQNREIPFESTGMTLAQALGRMGGLDDQKANPSGAFIFRYETPDEERGSADNAQRGPLAPKTPVIYRINLKDPSSFFAAQIFQIRDKDVVYVSAAPFTDVQKFVNIISSSLFPILSVQNAIDNN